MSVTPPKPKTYPEYIEGDNAPDKKIILPVCFHYAGVVSNSLSVNVSPSCLIFSM